MSYALIRAALENRLNEISPPIPTAWENVEFTRPNAIHQNANLLPADTSNPSYGDNLNRESGIFQVTVFAPNGKGSVEAINRAEAIRECFHRGLSIVNGDVTVIINRTPSIERAMNDKGYYMIPVSIPYFSDL